MIHIARRLYANEDFGVELDQTVYALDSTTIDLCLSLFPWARFRKRKGAVKMHTLLDLRGNIPVFIQITDGKVYDVNILDNIIPKRLNLDMSLYSILQILSVIVFEKLPVLQVLTDFNYQSQERESSNQLLLFDS